MHLILFDIDGTLLHCGVQVREIFRSTLVETYGSEGPLDTYDFSGKTDERILTELMAAAGLAQARIRSGRARFRRLYFSRLEAELEADGMRLLPGVPEALEQLVARPDVTLGLLTGNWERGARIKLSRFDLNRFFPFGAFGDGREDRRLLPPLALERARRAVGAPFRPQETLIVGDSPQDVECARAHGIRSLAVATGWTSAAELAEAGADWVVGSLEEAGRCLPVFAA